MKFLLKSNLGVYIGIKDYHDSGGERNTNFNMQVEQPIKDTTGQSPINFRATGYPTKNSPPILGGKGDNSGKILNDGISFTGQLFIFLLIRPKTNHFFIIIDIVCMDFGGLESLLSSVRGAYPISDDITIRINGISASDRYGG